MVLYKLKSPVKATQWNRLGDHKAVKPATACGVQHIGNMYARSQCGGLLTSRGWIVVYPGDYVVDIPGGLHDIVKRDLFEQLFEKE